MVQDIVEGTVGQFVSKEAFPEEWDLDGLRSAVTTIYPTKLRVRDLEKVDDADEVRERVLEEALATYQEKEEDLGPDVMRDLERMVLLTIIDNRWREHLYEMDYLEEGIHLRAYGQRDPLTEYRREAFQMFEEMKDGIADEFVKYIYHVELVRQDEPARPRPQRVMASHGDDEEGAADAS